MKTTFYNVDKNMASQLIYKNFINLIKTDIYGNDTEVVIMPRINLGDDILTIICRYSFGDIERIIFYSTDNLRDDNVYVFYDGWNQNGENRYWKISQERYKLVERFLNDCEEVMNMK